MQRTLPKDWLFSHSHWNEHTYVLCLYFNSHMCVCFIKYVEGFARFLKASKLVCTQTPHTGQVLRLPPFFMLFWYVVSWLSCLLLTPNRLLRLYHSFLDSLQPISYFQSLLSFRQLACSLSKERKVDIWGLQTGKYLAGIRIWNCVKGNSVVFMSIILHRVWMKVALEAEVEEYIHI